MSELAIKNLQVNVADTEILKGVDLTIEERLDIIQDLLGTEGFTMEWEHKDNGYHIREVNCPYYHVGQSHPEVCAVDETLISNMLSVPIEKVKCILNGDSYCTYIVPDAEETESNP